MSIHAMSTYLMPEAVLGFGKGEKKKKEKTPFWLLKELKFESS